MPWSWNSVERDSVSVLRYSADLFAYVVARAAPSGPQQVLQWGALWRGQDSAEQFAKRVRALGVGQGKTHALAVLEASDYQVLKIAAPRVPPSEMKAAARWQIKGLIDTPLDDLTLDVLQVGITAPHSNSELFVIAAGNAQLQALTSRCAASKLDLQIIDIWETALRNLQSAQARLDGVGERACALLFVQDGQCWFSICADGELYFARRLDWDDRLSEPASLLATQPDAALEQPLGYEYMPGDDLDQGAAASATADYELDLIIELQRTLDGWERSWPALPLARLYLLLPDEVSQNGGVARLMQTVLRLPVIEIALAALFTGLPSAGERRDEFLACMPLLGACLRVDVAH